MHESVTPQPARATRTAAWGMLALLAAAAFTCLGLWQWHKGQLREAQWDDFSRGAQVLLDLGSAATTRIALYQRVRVEGTLDGQHQFLLDNRSYRGTAGYEVLTPLRRTGAATLLVDRGWVPFTGSRSQLPAVGLPAEPPLSLNGRLSPLPSGGLALGHAAPVAGGWPKVTAFPQMPELAAAYGAALEPRILLLDPSQPSGYVRDWQPPGMAPLRHFSYAIQWWSFAALAVFLWGFMSLRKRRSVVKA